MSRSILPPNHRLYPPDRSFEGKFPDDFPRGAGNLSVPILIGTALEIVAALYVGKTDYTEYKDGKKKYNATENVKEFIEGW